MDVLLLIELIHTNCVSPIISEGAHAIGNHYSILGFDMDIVLYVDSTPEVSTLKVIATSNLPMVTHTNRTNGVPSYTLTRFRATQLE